MKKILSLILALAMVFCLTACGSTAGNDADNTEGSNSADITPMNGGSCTVK